MTNRANYDIDEVCYSVTGDKEGELDFCEAVKVDVSKTKEATFPSSITHTLSLISAIFEDFCVAVELHERARKVKKSEVAFPFGYSILFNETFKFEQGFLEKDFDALQKECLKSLE